MNSRITIILHSRRKTVHPGETKLKMELFQNISPFYERYFTNLTVLQPLNMDIVGKLQRQFAHHLHEVMIRGDDNCMLHVGYSYLSKFRWVGAGLRKSELLPKWYEHWLPANLRQFRNLDEIIFLSEYQVSS